MNLLDLDDLKPAPYNPREMAESAYDGLSASIFEFGDISGVVFNERTGHLVSGHQRVSILRQRGATLECGDDGSYRIVDPGSGEVFPVRVVDWDVQKEKAANVSANNPHIAGVFTDGLQGLLGELKEFDGFGELKMFPLLSEKEPFPMGGADEGSTEPEPIKCPKCGAEFVPRKG